jgi:transcriptional regulator with XRE-family HTH domain
MRFRRGDRSAGAIAYRIKVILAAHDERPVDMVARLKRGGYEIGPPAIDNWLKERNPPGVVAAQHIADAYRLTLDFIFDGKDDGLPGNVRDELIQHDIAA